MPHEGVTVPSSSGEDPVALLIGLDIGTSNIKAAAYDASGPCRAQASFPTPTEMTGVRLATQDPEALWNTAAAALREVLEACQIGGEVSGVCVASVGEAGVPLDAHGRPTHPIIAWYDERTVPLLPWWRDYLGPAAIFAITGLPLGHTFSLFKLQWLRQQIPDAWARTRRWLGISDYIGYRLTGEQVMGYSLASRTMALDLQTRSWSADLLDAAEVPQDLLPALAPEGTFLGRVHAEAAEATGLPAGTPVLVGGHDHPVAAVALGATSSGIVLDSTGTTETELMAIPSVEAMLERDDQRFSVGCHALPGSFYIKGAILGAGSLLTWAANLLFPELPEQAKLDALERVAACSPAGAKGLYLLPHFGGAGSPDRDSAARGVIAGLTTHHTRDDMARAVLEGLTYELRALWEALEASAGYRVTRVIATGGGSQSVLWNHLKANVTGRAIAVSQQPEAVTLGAAMLAGLGSGQYASLEDAQKVHSPPTQIITPEPELAATYDQLYHERVQCIRAASAHLGAMTGHLWATEPTGDSPTASP